MAAVEQPDAVVSGGNSDRRWLVRLSVATGVWALWYAAYRAYYAAGGIVFLPGTIRQGSEGQFQLVNLAGAVIIGTAAVLPIAVLPLWSRQRPRPVLLAVCWAIAVGCCMHALVGITGRVLSLAGLMDVSYPPLWESVDHRAADLQDLFFNEPWFLVQGLAFGALGWIGLGPGRSRRWWTWSAVAATAALLLLGVLTMTGLVGKVIGF